MMYPNSTAIVRVGNREVIKRKCICTGTRNNGVREERRNTYSDQERDRPEGENLALNRELKVRGVDEKEPDLERVRVVVVDKLEVDGVVRRYQLEYRSTNQRNGLTNLNDWKRRVRVVETVTSEIPEGEMPGVE
jgi:hypothetical protein